MPLIWHQMRLANFHKHLTAPNYLRVWLFVGTKFQQILETVHLVGIHFSNYSNLTFYSFEKIEKSNICGYNFSKKLGKSLITLNLVSKVSLRVLPIILYIATLLVKRMTLFWLQILACKHKPVSLQRLAYINICMLIWYTPS